MKNTGKLERLIASLSKNEKAYFGRWTLNSSKEKQYMEVFRIIDRNPSITTEKLMKKLGPDIRLKKLNTLKSHLWSVLVLSLRDYHRKTELTIEMNARLDAIKVLRKKGLLDLALKDAERLLSDSEEMEIFSVAIQALEHIENIYALQGLPDTEADAVWQSLYQKKERVSLHLAEINRIRLIERNLKLTNDRLGVTLNSKEHRHLVERISNDLRELDVSEDACFDVRFRYYQTQAIIARFFNDRIDEQQWFEKVFVLLEENPIITRTYYTAFYIVALHNYVDALLFLRKLDRVPELLMHMKKRLGEHSVLVGRDFFIYANDTLTFYTLKENYKQGLQEWDALEKIQPEQNETMMQDAFARFTILGSVLCFWNEEYKRAVSTLRKLFNQLDFEDEIINIARMLEILCNYELGDIEHTDHLIGSFLRKQSANVSSTKMEVLVVQTISEQLKSSKSSSENWKILAQKLETLSEISDEYDKLFTFDMVKYVKRKVSPSLH